MQEKRSLFLLVVAALIVAMAIPASAAKPVPGFSSLAVDAFTGGSTDCYLTAVAQVNDDVHGPHYVRFQAYDSTASTTSYWSGYPAVVYEKGTAQPTYGNVTIPSGEQVDRLRAYLFKGKNTLTLVAAYTVVIDQRACTLS